MRPIWMALVLAIAVTSAGCAELALVGVGAAGGYVYRKGQQSGKTEKSGTAGKSDTGAPAAPTQPTKTSD